MRLYLIIGLTALLAMVFATDGYAKTTRNRKRSKSGTCIQTACPDTETPTPAGDKQRKRDQKRLKDGSCLGAADVAPADIAKDQKRDQKRRKDGSCLAANRTGKRDQKRSRDGSCTA